MNETLRKRFWKETCVEEVDRGFGITLDGRPLRTPAKSRLVLPTLGLAEEVCAEWDMLSDSIDPTLLPFTKLCNAAIDNMESKRTQVVDVLSDYADTDLICYRAESPMSLVEAQDAAWNPLIAWTHRAHGVLLKITAGVLPVEQPKLARENAHLWLSELDDFALMATHDLVVLSGSVVITRALVEGQISRDEAWGASLVDEKWQAEQWGHDDEAVDARHAKQRDFNVAASMYDLLTKV